jgi:hypothetical protein
MYHLFRDRRLWLVFLVAAVLLFLFSSGDIQSWAGTREQESSPFEDAGLFESTEQLSQLHTGEHYAHQHSIKWTNVDGIPDTRVFAHVPGK